MYKVLFVEAHQDDIISSAGTVIKLKRAGCQLIFICTTDSRYDYLVNTPSTPSSVAKKLDSAAKECCQFLGIEEFINLGYEDGFYSYNEKTVKEMVSLIRKYKPDIIFTHWPIDNNPDHANTAKVTERAIQLANWPFYREGEKIVTDCNVLALYLHRSDPRQTMNFIADLYIDVSDVIDKIEEAAKKFTKLSPPEIEEKFIKRTKMSRAYTGIELGKNYVEAIAKSRRVGIQSWQRDPLIEISRKVNFPFLVEYKQSL